MKIIIDYHSSWRNSVLTGSNDEPVQKRNFKASSKSKEAIDVREISKNTVLGVLCRLIGDQRKLYQAKATDDFYFKNLDITFQEVHSKSISWNETAFLINKSENRPPQSSFLGVLNEDEPLFFSKYAYTLWSVLFYDFEELLDFINSPNVSIKNGKVSPREILNRVRYEVSTMERIEFIDDRIKSLKAKLEEELLKPKPRETRVSQLNEEIEVLVLQSQIPKNIAFERKLKDAINRLSIEFPDQSYYEKSNSVYPSRLYAASLYLMILEMNKQDIDVSSLITKSGSIKGFSKRSFNGVRDFLNSLTGNKKKTTHTPYPLTKASGQLEITLDLDFAKAKELKQMIDDAGVSSFYLGKKGLAYVSDIDIREVA